MDINQLLHNHRLARMNARTSGSLIDRETYFDLAGYYEKRISAWRRAEGLSESGWPGATFRPQWTRH